MPSGAAYNARDAGGGTVSGTSSRAGTQSTSSASNVRRQTGPSGKINATHRHTKTCVKMCGRRRIRSGHRLAPYLRRNPSIGRPPTRRRKVQPEAGGATCSVLVVAPQRRLACTPHRHHCTRKSQRFHGSVVLRTNTTQKAAARRCGKPRPNAQKNKKKPSPRKKTDCRIQKYENRPQTYEPNHPMHLDALSTTVVLTNKIHTEHFSKMTETYVRESRCSKCVWALFEFRNGSRPFRCVSFPRHFLMRSAVFFGRETFYRVLKVVCVKRRWNEHPSLRPYAGSAPVWTGGQVFPSPHLFLETCTVCVMMHGVKAVWSCS